MEIQRQFHDACIARADNGDCYDAEGIIACHWIDGETDVVGISEYCHCSCNDTEDVLRECPEIEVPANQWWHHYRWDWTGSPHELYQWAIDCRWFYVPHKEIDPADLGCARLIEFYRNYVEWYRTQYPGAGQEDATALTEPIQP